MEDRPVYFNFETDAILLETSLAMASLYGAFPDEDLFDDHDDDEVLFERRMTYELTQMVQSVAIGCPANPTILYSFTASKSQLFIQCYLCNAQC